MRTDGFSSYDGLVGWATGTTAGSAMARRSSSRGAPGQLHKRHRELMGLRQEKAGKVPSIAREDFYLHLKECEFRFNTRDRGMYKFLLSELRRSPLN